MFDRFLVETTDTSIAELMKYCKMENVSLAELQTEKTRENMEYKLKSAAVHMLQRVDKVLHSAINRLSVNGENSGMAQGQLS